MDESRLSSNQVCKTISVTFLQETWPTYGKYFQLILLRKSKLNTLVKILLSQLQLYITLIYCIVYSVYTHQTGKINIHL